MDCVTDNDLGAQWDQISVTEKAQYWDDEKSLRKVVGLDV